MRRCPDGPVNHVEMRVVGMSRSGNHAIVDWILDQVGGRTSFLNCAEPATNPFVTNRPLGADGIGHRTTIRGFDLAAEAAGRLSRKDLLLGRGAGASLSYQPIGRRLR